MAKKTNEEKVKETKEFIKLLVLANVNYNGELYFAGDTIELEEGDNEIDYLKRVNAVREV